MSIFNYFCWNKDFVLKDIDYEIMFALPLVIDKRFSSRTLLDFNRLSSWVLKILGVLIFVGGVLTEQGVGCWMLFCHISQRSQICTFYDGRYHDFSTAGFAIFLRSAG